MVLWNLAVNVWADWGLVSLMAVVAAELSVKNAM